jgi:hypothetical protein
MNLNEIYKNIVLEEIGSWEDFFPDMEFEHRYLANEFLNQFVNGRGIDHKEIPKQILNSLKNPFHPIENFEVIYTGTKKGKDISTIQSWSWDEETAWVFSMKWDSHATVIELTAKIFKKQFKYFVVLDSLYNWLMRNVPQEAKDILKVRYYSESEILVLK